MPACGAGQAEFSTLRAPTTGDLVVTTATTGANLPAGYTVTVDDRLQAIGINDRMTFPALAAGGHTGALCVAAHCPGGGRGGAAGAGTARGPAGAGHLVRAGRPPPQPPVYPH